MTRKDFRRIAQGLAAIRSTMAPEVFEAVVDQMALACGDMKDTGTIFDYGLFEAACYDPIKTSPVSVPVS